MPKLTYRSLIEKAKKGAYRVKKYGKRMMKVKEYREYPLKIKKGDVKIFPEREPVKVPGKPGKPRGPTLRSLEKAGAFFKGIEKETSPKKTGERSSKPKEDKGMEFTVTGYWGEKKKGDSEVEHKVTGYWEEGRREGEKEGEEEKRKREEEKEEEEFRCAICGKPLPPGVEKYPWKGKYVCHKCLKELKEEEEEEKRKREEEKKKKKEKYKETLSNLKAGIAGTIILLPLFLLSWISIWAFLIALIAFFGAGFTKNKWARGPLILIGVGVVGWSMMSLPFVQAYLPMDQINEVLYELNLKKAYVECLITHMTDVENIMNYGGLDALCKKLIYEVQAVKEGCTECLELKVETEVPLAIPGRSYLFRLEYNMDEGADLPATNIISTFYIDDEPLEDGLTRCNEEDPCILYPGDWEESSVRLDKYEIPCEKDSFKYTVVTRYNYTSRGYTHFYITDNRRIYEKRKAITSSGPLDIVVASDSSYYRKDEDARIFLALTFVNKGKGKITINDITIVEIIPDSLKDGDYCSNGDCSLLSQTLNDPEHSGCDYKLKPLGNNMWTIEDLENLEEFREVKAEKKCLFSCEINIGGFFKKLPGPYVTYTYEVIVNYAYEKNQTGQVWVDTTYPCITKPGGSGWKAYLNDSCKIDECSVKGDKTSWYTPSFKEAGWKDVKLPDRNWGCENCMKYYRKRFLWDGESTVWLNISSDDGVRCWVNGDPIGDPYWNDYLYECHGENKRHESCSKLSCDAEGCTCQPLVGSTSPSCLYKDISSEKWDYSWDITSYLKKDEKNLIACQVYNVIGSSAFGVH